MCLPTRILIKINGAKRDGFVKINSHKEVWMTVLAVNALASFVVSVAVLIVYPTDLWRYELTLGLSLTLIIATPVSYFLAQQIRRNIQLTTELQRLVDRDRLTDVGTRDFFFNCMEEAPDAYGVSLMIDIDHFKGINDAHGHIAGDEVIKSVAQLLKKTVRDKDIVARFGGEEFMVFLHGHDPHSGYVLAERMRERIANHVFKVKDLSVNVTVSIGGSLKDAYDGVEQAIQDADAALYKAKEHGRNQTIFAGKRRSKKSLVTDQPLVA